MVPRKSLFLITRCRGAANCGLGVPVVPPLRLKPTPDNNVSVSMGIELKAGYVIDPSEPGQPEQKIVGGVVEVIDAKCRA